MGPKWKLENCGILFTLILLLTGGLSPAWSQKTSTSPLSLNRSLNVAVFVEPPFVIQTETGYTGFSIELWETIARDAGWKWTYVPTPNLIDLVDDISSGKADVAITALAITEDRLQRVDFTQPYLDAGLQIMVDSKRPASVRHLWQGLEEDGRMGQLRSKYFGTE